MEPPLWTAGASPWPHEREALAFVQARLPNHEPYRAWNNVEFIAGDGSVNEVDLLVVTPRGFFLVEIKSWPGTISGDSQKWRLRRPNGSQTVIDHPLLLATRKAKRLRSLLARQPPFRHEQPPWVTPLIFLSAPDLDCQLRDIGRASVCGRDGEPPPPGIVATVKDPATAGLRGTSVNRPLSLKVAEALEQAGLKPSNRGRRVGDWELDDLLDEGPGWQDFAATRPRVEATRRVRIYLAGAATTTEEEDRLRRQADREFRVVHDLRHDGIAQPLDLVQAERGPALLFDRHADEERLDLWAPAGVTTLDFGARIELVRQLAEAIAHAHSRKVTHRALTARSVLVRPAPTAPGLPRLLVGHWQAGARDLATRLTSHPDEGTSLGSVLTDRLDAAEQVYLAPEAFTAEEPDGTALDLFSLGALAFLILSGQPPAADLVEREAVLAAHCGFALSAAVDNAPEDLVTLVGVATDPVPARRGTVKDVLDLLDEALDKLTTPPATSPDTAEPPEPADTTDPLQAHQGSRLPGGWEVVRRLGSGSTAVAFLCTRTGSAEPEVLKVAKDEDHAERLLEEARALESLRHPGIVQLLGVERIGGRTTLRLAPAGDPEDKVGMTLSDLLDARGRVELDLLDRWGTDLLDIVDFLEHEGIPHRDIKPDNLGVRPRRGDRSLHLVLFDFSLARTSDSNLGAGTPGYLDPFLAERPSRRWDPPAERYAAAVTLFEMATGTRPVWGDGRTDPVHLADEAPRIEPDVFDPAVRDGLVRFFARALHRRPGSRFDSADRMRQAWRAVFAAAARPLTSSGHDADGPAGADHLDRLAESASLDTPVTELGLSGAAISTLERLGLGTTGQLLDYPSAKWAVAPGVGLQVRREVQEVVTRLRARNDLDPGDPAASIDRLAGRLVPQAGADRAGLLLLLGLQPHLASTAPLDAAGDGAEVHRGAPTVAWPALAELKARLGLDRAAYDALVERGRSRWLKEPAVTQVRNELHTILERAGGVLAGDELALALAAHRGSTATGPDRLRRARAVVRAALEAEAGREGNRFTWRRLGGGSAAVVALRTDALDAEVLADFAASLGGEADKLAGGDPLLGPSAVVERLRRVPPPAGLAPLPDHRLVRLAAASSATAAVSSRLEVYPRDLSPARAVRLARTALLGPGTLSEEEVRNRVRTRFPRALPLPDRPALDDLLRHEVGLEWRSNPVRADGAPLAPGFGVTSHRPASPTSATSVGGRYRTGTHTGVPEEERERAENVDERLERHAANGGYLVLTVVPKHQQRAIAALARIGAAPVSVDAVLIGSLRAHAEARKINWDQAILAADAEGPDGEQWKRLLNVVRDAVAPVGRQLLTGPAHVLLTHPGLLARYELLGMLDELRERTNRQPEPGQTLRTLWVLVPADDPEGPVNIAGKAVPALPPERLALPRAWLDNVHRTVAAGGARP